MPLHIPSKASTNKKIIPALHLRDQIFLFLDNNKEIISVINGNVSPFYLATMERVLRNL